MSTHKQIEFEVDSRTYRIRTHLDNTYDIYGFNSLREQVSIHTDLITGEQVFVSWSLIPVIRFTDAAEDAAEL